MVKLLQLIVFGVATFQVSFLMSAELRIGRAAVDITPESGTPMLTPQRPPFTVKLAVEPHDPLQVKAIVLDEGGVRAAIVSCDLTSIPLQLIEKARRLIAESTDISADAVMINATHTHTTPQIRLKYLGKADDAARRKAAEYIEALPVKIAEAVRHAEEDLQSASVSAAIGNEGSVSFNRRFFLQNGQVEANPFKGEDWRLGEIHRPTGPIDPEVGVVAFHSSDGEPLVVLINFAIHLDTMGGDQPSADFPYVVEKLVKSALGPEVLVFWASGASGNINHYSLLDPERARREKGPHESSRIGTVLAAETLRAYSQRETLQKSPLRVTRELVRVDYRPEKTERLQAQMEESSKSFDGEVPVFKEDGKITFEAEVQVISLGNELAWASFPGEMFVELGLSLKAASPFQYTMIHTLANGAIGYVPNLRAYPEGGYGADHSRCAPGGGERLIESATHQLVKHKNSDRSSDEGQQHAFNR